MSTQRAEQPAIQAQTASRLDVELVYARPESVWRHALQLASDSTVQDALELSGFFQQFPDYSTNTVRVGIYGQSCALDRQVKHNDRIEIYRELTFDPMESRRRRARHRQQAK